MADRDKKKRDERNLKILQDLLQQPGNDRCADCGERGPKWASVNLGVFVYENLDVRDTTYFCHLKNGKLTQKEQLMTKWGNTKANAQFLAGGAPPAPSQSDSDMETYIRNKYERRVYERAGNPSRQYEAVDAPNSRDEANYANQLRTLSSMGFNDTSRNIAALKYAKGNMDAAVEYLVSNSSSQSSSSPSRNQAPPPQPPRTISQTAPQSQRQQPQSTDPLQSAIEGLRNLGFTNDDDNRAALRQSGGKVEAAVNILLDRRRASSAVQQPVQAQVQQVQQQQQQRTGTPIPSGAFAIEPPQQSGRAQRGMRPATRQQQQGGVDLFGEGADFGGSATHGQNQGQSQAASDLFGLNEPPQPTEQPSASLSKPTVAKDSIMSLFNTPSPQQPHMMLGTNPFGMPQQQGYMMGGAPQLNPYGMNQMGMMQQQQGMMGMQQGMGMVRPGFGGMMPGPMMPGQGMQGQGMMGMQGQPAYATFSPARQAGPFGGAGFGTPPLGYTPPQSSTPRMNTPNPFGPSLSQSSMFGSQQQQQQPQQDAAPPKPDLFADLGPSFVQKATGVSKQNPFG
ncbi:hypothetical protein HK097_007475 [Rhizophlyctis rosea]|uniref:UBA domain-containing protein n=1 Tax=Rhizophlyctis rosea TaxID=64517 RepID=A0AAD5X8M9_9FUNG|nr:hypothetical protein HK097_007475 [Rhizophlyctis rosea]